MIEWLKRGAVSPPVLTIGGRDVPVIVRRLAQARRMTMRLALDGSEIRVSIPRWGSAAEALDFARAKSAWLEQQLAKLHPVSTVVAGSVLPFRGANLRIEHVPSAPRRPEIIGNTIRVGGPEAKLETRLRRWLMDQVRDIALADLEHYCARAGQAVPPLALSNAQRRWGSCSARGGIRINWRLIMAPDFVRQSVVAHEVAHLVHFDHSPRFYALLATLYQQDLALADRWLKQNGRSLYSLFS